MSIDFSKKDIAHKEYISKEAILRHFSSYDVFRYYCGDFEIGKAFKSPIKTEKKPSFNIFVHKSGQLFYKDFRFGSGDFVQFIREKYTLNYRDALSKICIDMGLSDLYQHNNIQEHYISKKEPVKYDFDIKEVKKQNISIRSRKWKGYDYEYWKQFGISLRSLKNYKVVPISHIFIGDNIIKAEPHAYAFIENKDGYRSYTIYQPFSENHKWLKDHDSSVWYGWEQLPKTGDTLIITKSRKDIMSIVDVLDIPSTGLQNEMILPKPQVVQELITRFKDIYVLYDNDYDKDLNYGVEFGRKFADEFYLSQIIIPSFYKSKDFSDLVKNHGQKVAKEAYKDMVNNILPF